MFEIASISLGDYAGIIIGVVGLLAAWLAKSKRLPKWARTWLDRITPEKIEQTIEEVDLFTDMTPEEKRQEVVRLLQEYCEQEFGFPIPTSIANLLVEFIYQQWKKRKG